MSDQQQTDEFTIYGLLPEHSARGQIRYEDFKSLVQDHLQLGPMYQLVMKILKDEYQIHIIEKMKLDIQTIFRCFSSIQFLREVPPFINNRITKQNIRIIKAAIHLCSLELLTMQDVKDATLIFQLKELEHMTEGLPCEVGIINSMLWKINKTISAKVLEEWIKKCADFFDIKGAIQAFEFLFLMANTVNRRSFQDKIPKTNLDINRDPKFNLFFVDSTGFTTLKNPDTKIQHYLNYQYNVEKATFEGRQIKDRNEYYQQRRIQKFDAILKQQNTSKNEFRKLLRDPELYVEIKTKLKNAHQLLNHSKLNGKMLRAQLKEELANQYVEAGPNITTKEVTKIEMVREQPTYVQKAQQRPQSAMFEKIKQDVNLHREMAKDDVFLTQYASQNQIGRTTSAVSVGSTKTTNDVKRFSGNNRSKNLMKNGLPPRPFTASFASVPNHANRINSYQSEVRNLGQTQQVIKTSQSNKRAESILQEELNSYESTNYNHSNTQEKFVFYGSSNSTKQQYKINLPWSTNPSK